MDEIQYLPLEALRESPFNPRQSYDTQALEKLAFTIKCDGVLQPLEVRPIPGQFDNPDAVERYEIVFGHRRFRASKLAGLERVPCIVRERSDEDAARVQLVENIQRDEVNPLEQAAAFRRLMTQHGLKAEDLAAQIGKSRAWVYSQLKLLNLTPELQQEVSSGRMNAEVAVQVASLHPKLQPEFVKRITFESADENGQKRVEFQSSRSVKVVMRSYFLQSLTNAEFNLEDPDLRPHTPACSECPKCTRNDPDLFETYGPDACTDSECFTDKTNAQLRRQVAEHEAQGLRVIRGDEAQTVAPNGYVSYQSPYKAVEAHASGGMRYVDAMAKMGDDAPPVVVIYCTHNTEHSVSMAISEADAERVREFLREGEAQDDADGPSQDSEDELTPEQQAVRSPHTWWVIEREIVRRVMAAPQRTVDELRLVAHTMVDSYYDLPEPAVQAFGWREQIDAWLESSDGSFCEEDWLHWYIEQMAADDLGRLVVVLAISQVPVKGKHVETHAEKLALCQAYGIDPLDPERAEPLPTPSTAARAAEEAAADQPVSKPKRASKKAAPAPAPANGELDLVGGDMHPELDRKVKDVPADAGDEVMNEQASPAGEVVA